MMAGCRRGDDGWLQERVMMAGCRTGDDGWLQDR